MSSATEREPLVGDSQRTYSAVEAQNEPASAPDEIAHESALEASTFYPHHPPF